MNGVKVYSSNLLDELVQDSKASKAGLTDEGSGQQSFKAGKGLSRMEAKKVMRNKAYWTRMNVLQKESERQVREKLELIRAKKERRFHDLCKGIDEGEEYLQEVEAMLNFHDQIEHRKRLARYNDWNENVYEKIQSGIKRASNKNSERIRKLRQDEYANFLRETNQKDNLFLDVAITSSYDPFVVNREGLKCKVGELIDPTKRVLTKYKEEQNMIPRDPRDKAAPEPNRGILPTRVWATGQIESTPHGYFSKLMNTQVKVRGADGAMTTADRVQVDHFDFPVGKDCVDTEYPRGKRTDFSYLNPDPTKAQEHDQPLIG